ncbi:MAG: hypothetical protein R3F56_19415 [Planctomycetota bacterium]
MHRWLAFVIVFMLAGAAAVLWPSPVRAAAAEEEGLTAPVPASAPSASPMVADTEGSVRTEVASEVDVAARPDIVITGPAETTRLLRTHLAEETTLSATFACRSVDRAVFDVAAGHADAAIVAEPFESILDDPRLRERALGDFVVALVRHRDNRVDHLTHEQVVAIARGRARTWADLGGDKRDLRAYSTFTGPADEARALQLGQGLTCVRERGLSAAQVMARVAREPGALGIVALRVLPASVPCITIDGAAPDLAAYRTGSYPFGYRLRLVHRAEPRPPLARFLAFLGGAEGQRMLRDLEP